MSPPELAAAPTPAERPFDPTAVAAFGYDGYDLDVATGRLTCRYALDDLAFEERITFDTVAVDVDPVAADAAARLVFLLAGVSYYKAAAPPVVRVPGGLRPAERSLLEATYRSGLGEYAFRNGLDLSGLRFEAPELAVPPSPPASAAARPLVPFGGGLDSIVTVEGVRAGAPEAALFVVSTGGVRFEAIEEPAAVAGLPVVRAGRQLDDKILRSRALGYRNGHVPVTGVISAIAVAAAVLDGRDAVIMSNEWSASAGNVEQDGRVVNHQWSKSLEFEGLFRAALASALPVAMDYFSWLRPFSELWVAHRFADLTGYHGAFRSCNRSFRVDPASRLDHWCGTCDKCAFIDLVLAPYLPAAELGAVFGARPEPLDDPAQLETFRTLTGLSGDIKPFECVGDVDECRVAALLAAARPDRATTPVLQALRPALEAVVAGDLGDLERRLLRPMGPHHVPERHAPPDLLG